MAADDLHGLWAVRGWCVNCQRLAWFKEEDAAAKARIVLQHVFLWVVMGIGFIASCCTSVPDARV
jgi:DMSO reductase anchor subunit